MSTPIVITHRGGLQFAAAVESHEIILDQPVKGGGEDTGPSPLALLGSGLGGCIALYVYQLLTARSAPTTGLRVEVESQATRQPYRISRFDVRIVVPDAAATSYRPLIEAVARVCPAYNTLAAGTEIVISVHSASEAPAPGHVAPEVVLQ